MTERKSVSPRRPAGATPSPYERIKSGILDGTLEPGFQLVESTMAEWCGVSRTPVREALTRLLHDGLVSKTDRGMIVRLRTPEEILDIYETRIALEVLAARCAAERHTQMDRLRLQRLLTMAEQDDGDAARCADRNREFHRGIWLASHNESLTDLLDRLNTHLLRYPMSTLSVPGRFVAAIKEHRALVEAILDREADRAADVARDHFTAARDVRLVLWGENLV